MKMKRILQYSSWVFQQNPTEIRPTFHHTNGKDNKVQIIKSFHRLLLKDLKKYRKTAANTKENYNKDSRTDININ